MPTSAAGPSGALSTLTNQAQQSSRPRGVKSPCTRSQTRRSATEEASWSAGAPEAAGKSLLTGSRPARLMTRGRAAALSVCARLRRARAPDETLTLFDLPDELLLHALSHLACEEVVTTSMRSFSDASTT